MTKPARIPGPKGLATIAARMAFARDPVAATRALIDKYGDTVRCAPDLYLIGAAEHVEAVLKEPEVFVRERGETEEEKALWGSGIVVSHGADWVRKRRQLRDVLTVEGSADTVIRVAAAELAGWQPGTRDIFKDLRRLTATVSVRNLLGDDIPAPEVVNALEAIMDMFTNRAQFRIPLETPQKRLFRDAIARLDELVTEQRDDVVTLLRAGHRNGSVLLTWIVGLLAHHPEIAAKAKAEVGDRPITPQDVPRLTYLGKIIRETMRLYPLYPLLDRTLAKDAELGGHHFACGTKLFLAIGAIHQDPEIFAEPGQFRPDRNLGRGSYPFGAGPRKCPFQSYALLEATLLAAELVRRFRFTPTSRTRLTPRYTSNGLMPPEQFQVSLSNHPPARG